ncbi:MAG: glycosyltransferase family 4 protein [Lachnospiraceae bacterium]|nr:glycosyltransferase family 4 protein [Lachnospiraceae bacterium]
MKTLTFYSNYFNHHQKALCDAFYARLGEGFTFVETMPIEDFRAGMGWGEDCPSYVLKTYESPENEERARQLGTASDLVIMGTAPEYYIEPRLSIGKIVFRYSERPLKEGFIKFFIPRLTKKYIHLHVRNRKKNIYILGASAFTSADFKKMFGSYPGKCYKFAYFPRHISYDPDELMKRKLESSRSAGAVTILWEGRMIRLKRADLLIKAAAELDRKGYDFRLRLVGDGDQKEKLAALCEKLGLLDKVTFEGFLKPDEARERMADAEIYVMTSNFLEGWGSVIYEAENAGCAVVASHACGATPWLVRHDITGLVFRSGSVRSLADKLERLIRSEELRQRLGRGAYEQMRSMWNPETAADRVIGLYNALEAGEGTPYEDGPCSLAETVKNNWFYDKD